MNRRKDARDSYSTSEKRRLGTGKRDNSRRIGGRTNYQFPKEDSAGDQVHRRKKGQRTVGRCTGKRGFEQSKRRVLPLGREDAKNAQKKKKNYLSVKERMAAEDAREGDKKKRALTKRKRVASTLGVPLLRSATGREKDPRPPAKQ